MLYELRVGALIYPDSSALLKLLFEEDESAALAQWISERAATRDGESGELVRIEVVRAARRLDRAVVPAAGSLVSLDLVPLTGTLIDEAADAPTTPG